MSWTRGTLKLPIIMLIKPDKRSDPIAVCSSLRGWSLYRLGGWSLWNETTVLRSASHRSMKIGFKAQITFEKAFDLIKQKSTDSVL
jgi:hypothetical protein